MSRKLAALAVAAMLTGQAQAARYITFSFKAGVTFDITFDMLSDPNGFGFPFLAEGDYVADIYLNNLEVFGTPPGTIDYTAGANLTGIDLSPAEFEYHVPHAGGWSALHIYYVGQYEFTHQIYGQIYNMVITGTDTPRPTGITTSGALQFGALPEPSQWIMMVGGFGAIGAMLRSRRKVRVSFA